jgi:hypothetical protein
MIVTPAQLQDFLDSWLSYRARELSVVEEKVPATAANFGDLVEVAFARYGKDAEITFYNLGCFVRLKVGDAIARIGHV